MELDEYLKKNGIKTKWIADQIGISPHSVSGYNRGITTLSSKYFTKIVVLTRGAVSYKDLQERNDKIREKRENKKSSNHTDNSELSD